MYSTYYVAPGGNCGTGVTPCYGTVQAAVDAADDPGDVIKVATGTYTDLNVRPRNDMTTTGVVTQVVYINKTVTIRGGYTTTDWSTSYPITQPTTLDAQGQGRVLYIAGEISPTVEAFRITGGDASGQGGSAWRPMGPGDVRDAGGGLYVITATAVIKNNEISNNVAPGSSFGGGLYLNRANAILVGNTIASNTTGYYGSGGGVAIWYSSAILEGNHISANHNNGIWLYGSMPTFSGNTITGNATDWNGGGIELYYGGARLDGNTIAANTAGRNGGGISLDSYSSAVMNGNVITGNVAASNGGALYVSNRSKAYLDNDLVADNQASSLGSGFYVEGASLRLTQATIARNSSGDGSGIYVTDLSWTTAYATVYLTNTVLVNHSIGISVTGGNTVTVNSILWHSTPITISQSITAAVAVQNQHVGDPAFAPDGYHLTVGSAAIDRGVNSGAAIDIDGQPRPAGAGYDLGADEVMPYVTVDPSTGNTLVYTDTLGSPTSILVPVGAVTETTTLFYTPVDIATSPSGFGFAGHAFQLDAYRTGVLIPGLFFETPITITVTYTDADVFGVDKSTLELRYWDGSQWSTDGIAVVERDTVNNRLVVAVAHLTEFAVFGETFSIYLPVVLRNYP